MKTKKTNAVRLLDQKKIPYTLHQAELGDNVDGMHVAEVFGEDPNHVFKTLVTTGKDKNHYVFLVPVNANLDLKKAAKAAGVKAIEMLPLKELFPLTGYVHGGCSPVGMKKRFATYIDQSALSCPTIYFSAGKIGEQIEIDPSLVEKELDIHPADLKTE